MHTPSHIIIIIIIVKKAAKISVIIYSVKEKGDYTTCMLSLLDKLPHLLKKEKHICVIALKIFLMASFIFLMQSM